MKKWNHNPHEPHRFRVTLATKINVEDPNKSMALANVSVITHRKTLRLHIATIFTPPWNNEFDLSNGSYSVLHIQDYFEYIN